jgi:hypothetical protein
LNPITSGSSAHPAARTSKSRKPAVTANEIESLLSH